MRSAALELVSRLRAGTGQRDSLRAQLLDLGRLVTKFVEFDPAAVDADLGLVDAPDVAALRATFRQATHLLTLLGTDRRAVLTTLLGWMAGDEVLDSLAEHWWGHIPFAHLRPAWPLPNVRTSGLVRTLTGHQQPITTCHFSADDGMLVSSDRSGRTLAWEVASAQQIHEYLCGQAPDGFIRHPALCVPGPDEQLAVALECGLVQVWCLRGGQEELRQELRLGGVKHVLFFSDGMRLLTVDGGHRAQVWDLVSGAPLLTAETRPPVTGGVAPMRGIGQWLAVAGWDGAVEVYDLSTGLHHRTFSRHRADVVVIDAWGSSFVSTDSDGVVRVWDPASGACSATFAGVRGNVVVAYDAGRLVMPRGRSRVQIRDPASGDAAITVFAWRLRQRVVRRYERVTASLNRRPLSWLFTLYHRRFGTWSPPICAASRDLSWVVTVDDWRSSRGNMIILAHEVAAFDPATGRLRARTRQPDTCTATAWTRGRPSPWFATITSSGEVYVWNPCSGELRQSIDSIDYHVSATAAARHDELLAVGDQTGRIRLIEPLRTPRQADADEHARELICCVVDPQGTWLAVTDQWRRTRLYDPVSGMLRHHLDCQLRLAFSGAGGTIRTVSPDGTWLACGDDNGPVRIWDTKTGRLLHVLPAHDGHVATAAVTATGPWLATAHHDGRLRIWDPLRGRLLRTLHGPTTPVTATSVDSTGTLLASGNASGEVLLWDPTQERPPRLLGAHRGRAGLIVVDPTARWVATAGGDGLVQIWDLVTGQPRTQSMSFRASRVTAATTDPTGTILVTGHHDGELRAWDLTTTGPPRTLPPHQQAVQDCALAPQGRWLASVDSSGIIQVCDLRGGTRPARFALDGLIRQCRWLPSGRRLLVVGRGGLALFKWQPREKYQ